MECPTRLRSSSPTSCCPSPHCPLQADVLRPCAAVAACRRSSWRGWGGGRGDGCASAKARAPMHCIERCAMGEGEQRRVVRRRPLRPPPLPAPPPHAALVRSSPSPMAHLNRTQSPLSLPPSLQRCVDAHERNAGTTDSQQKHRRTARLPHRPLLPRVRAALYAVFCALLVPSRSRPCSRPIHPRAVPAHRLHCPPLHSSQAQRSRRTTALLSFLATVHTASTLCPPLRPSPPADPPLTHRHITSSTPPLLHILHLTHSPLPLLSAVGHRLRRVLPLLGGW